MPPRAKCEGSGSSWLASPRASRCDAQGAGGASRGSSREPCAPRPVSCSLCARAPARQDPKHKCDCPGLWTSAHDPWPPPRGSGLPPAQQGSRTRAAGCGGGGVGLPGFPAAALLCSLGNSVCGGVLGAAELNERNRKEQRDGEHGVPCTPNEGPAHPA